jgi:hypothetical protein
MSMEKNEHWIDEAMEHDPFNNTRSLPSNLRNQMKDIPNKVEAKVNTLPSTHVWLAAAGIALLISVNVLAMTEKQEETASNDDQSLYGAYFSTYTLI